MGLAERLTPMDRKGLTGSIFYRSLPIPPTRSGQDEALQVTLTSKISNIHGGKYHLSRSSRQHQQNRELMKKGIHRGAKSKSEVMRAEYDFARGVRGKHYKSLQAGYTITVLKKDGSKVVKEVKPAKGVARRRKPSSWTKLG